MSRAALLSSGWTRVALRWLLLAAALNLVWEIVQLPLYTIYHEASPAEIAFAVAHCTAGDVLIALATYSLASVVARDFAWPVHRPGTGTAAAVVAGAAYTAFSEWLNVSVRGSWAYAQSMPQVWNVGVAPLLQWILVPTLTLYLIRASERAGAGD
jgi:hypothetical protein